jgi:asparagine N-glycosylation enzyme membrane subunit Stt3
MSRRTIVLKHFKNRIFRLWLDAVEKMYPPGMKVDELPLWTEEEE